MEKYRVSFHINTNLLIGVSLDRFCEFFTIYLIFIHVNICYSKYAKGVKFFGRVK